VRPGGWSQTIRPCSLPYGMDVVLGDVCGGSNSPSMVRVACSGCAPHLLSVGNVQRLQRRPVVRCRGFIACGMARTVLRAVTCYAVVLSVWSNACAVLSGVVQQFYHYSTHCSRV
jgi:hypothetical protein